MDSVNGNESEDLGLQNSADAGAKSVEPGKISNQSDDLWLSYEDEGSTSYSQAVSLGLRVEDIVEPASLYSYASFNKSDPFIAPYYHQKEMGELEFSIVSVLQNYALEEMKIAGIWQSVGGDRKALMIAGEGEEKVAVEVLKGDPIGKRAGVVLEVKPKSVLVREFYLARDGTREFEDIEMIMSFDDSTEIVSESKNDDSKNIQGDKENFENDGVKIIETLDGRQVKSTQKFGKRITGKYESQGKTESDEKGSLAPKVLDSRYEAPENQKNAMDGRQFKGEKPAVEGQEKMLEEATQAVQKQAKMDGEINAPAAKEMPEELMEKANDQINK